MSGIVESAKKIIEANGLSDKIEIIRGKVEEISLPEGIDKVQSSILKLSLKICFQPWDIFRWTSSFLSGWDIVFSTKACWTLSSMRGTRYLQISSTLYPS